MNTKDKNRMHATEKTVRHRAPAISNSSDGSDAQIIYTPAKPFNRNRFLLRLATVAAVVLALVLGMSIFFRAKNVTVSGAQKYTPWEIKEASGIRDGDPLLNLSEAKISARIRAALPYVGNVRVGIKLPDTVNIEITELQVVYAVEDNNAAWWLMDGTGRVVDSTDAAAAKDYTRILGVKIQDAVVGKQAVASETTQNEGTQTESMPSLPAAFVHQQLDAAIQILAALEINGMMGKIDTVDVSDVRQLSLWYENRYDVSLGDTSRLDYKISAMKAAIGKMGEYQSGYMDVSFTIWQNRVGYRPFDQDSGTKK